jgi:hypothetical protein
LEARRNATAIKKKKKRDWSDLNIDPHATLLKEKSAAEYDFDVQKMLAAIKGKYRPLTTLPAAPSTAAPLWNDIDGAEQN